MAKKITTAEFENEVLNAKGTVLVDFFATWCGPCKMLAPHLDELSAKNPEVKIVKIDVDEETPLAIKYGVASIPTLLLFKDGEKVNQTLGYQTLDQLERFVQ
ncbi:MAG: thioredoxin [Ruminococcaceae bacterium]|nr:thioredoxin [Oscillospiraceae bacterium]